MNKKGRRILEYQTVDGQKLVCIECGKPDFEDQYSSFEDTEFIYVCEFCGTHHVFGGKLETFSEVVENNS